MSLKDLKENVFQRENVSHNTKTTVRSMRRSSRTSLRGGHINKH